MTWAEVAAAVLAERGGIAPTHWARCRTAMGQLLQSNIEPEAFTAEAGATILEPLVKAAPPFAVPAQWVIDRTLAALRGETLPTPEGFNELPKSPSHLRKQKKATKKPTKQTTAKKASKAAAVWREWRAGSKGRSARGSMLLRRLQRTRIG